MTTKLETVAGSGTSAAANGSRSEEGNRRAFRAVIAETRRQVRAGLDISAYEGADPIGSVGQALWSLALIALAYYITAAAFQLFGPVAGLGAYLLALLLIARQQRVLELLVHDASHGAFSRRRKWNDWICDLLAGAPVMQLAAQYRLTHKVHHQQFGGELDPCRGRMFLRREGQGLLAWMRSLAASLPSYLADYYGSVASTSWRPVAASVVWHAVLVCGLGFGLSWGPALAAWLLFWAVPFALVLPLIRMQAEADEHNYDKGCEAWGTFTNKGWLNCLLIHPGSDLYHLAHHAFPAIPIRRLRRFDRHARRVSPLYRQLPVRYR